MNNVIDKILTEIRFNIPEEILKLGFMPSDANAYDSVLSLDELMLTTVIRARVLKDANIYGGKTKDIVLRPEYREKLTRNRDDAQMNTGPFSLYRIPADERENSPISEVHHLIYRGNYAGYVPNTNGWQGGVNLMTLGNAILDSHTFASMPPRPKVELLSGDLVRLIPSQHSQEIWVMTCRICYDENFTNLNTSAINPLADLCVCAVKSYIYNRLIIQLDRGQIEAGTEIGTFKSIIEGWSDQYDRYKELLDLFRGSILLDPLFMTKLLPYML